MSETTEQENNRNADGTFKPGISGNPGGRPKGTMKNYLSEKFLSMSDSDKEAFLLKHGVSGKDQIEFGEGKAKQDTDITSGGQPLTPLLVRFLDNDSNNGNTQGV